MPSWEFPEVPYPSAGGITASTRLPTFWPMSAVSRPGSMVPPITVGFWVKVFAFRVEVFPLQKYRTKFAAMASDLVIVVPVPGITVLTVSLLFASSFGIFTVGEAPNAPPTVTEEFAFEWLAAPPELELGFDEPQPAMTRQASSGITVIDRRRRMKKPQCGGRRAQSAYWLFCPGGTTPLEPPACPLRLLSVVPRGRGPVGPRGRAGYIPAMSFSTRSSTERKGSLHRTVRWAWSFSFRCTQSTVKSRRFSCARRMNSPRSLARVVCGGTDLA